MVVINGQHRRPGRINSSLRRHGEGEYAGACQSACAADRREEHRDGVVDECGERITGGQLRFAK